MYVICTVWQGETDYYRHEGIQAMVGKVEMCGDSKAVLSYTLLSSNHPTARAFPKWHTGSGLGLVTLNDYTYYYN